MAFEKLSPDEKRVIWECMNAIHTGKLIDDSEFQTRLGIERDELGEVISNYPYLKDTEAVTKISINNCLNEIAHGIGLPDHTWSMWFSVSREQVGEVYNKWAKHSELKSTGIM